MFALKFLCNIARKINTTNIPKTPPLKKQTPKKESQSTDVETVQFDLFCLFCVWLKFARILNQ